MNWRQHPQAQADALTGMLAEIGFADAVIARETPEGLQLIDGHLRQDIMGDQEIPVLVVDLSEDEAAKMLITLDPLAGLAETNDDMLRSLMESVQFEDARLNTLLQQLAPAPIRSVQEDPGPQMDRAVELQAKWGTEREQIWEIGRHRLMCGDATSAEDVGGALLAGQKPGLMVTDPPYGVDYDPAWRVKAAEEGHLAYAARRIGAVRNDDCADWKEAWDCFPGDVVYSWHPAGAPSLVHAKAIEEAGFVLRMQIIWAKSNFPI